MNEKLIIENTLKLLKRGKWEMEGEEILAFHQVFAFWVNKLKELNKPPVPTPTEAPIKPSKGKK